VTCVTVPTLLLRPRGVDEGAGVFGMPSHVQNCCHLLDELAKERSGSVRIRGCDRLGETFVQSPCSGDAAEEEHRDCEGPLRVGHISPDVLVPEDQLGRAYVVDKFL
jgi:hypothetical protein